MSHAYRNYWQRKRLLAEAPPFAVTRFWPCGDGQLADAERVIFEAVNDAPSLLDVGAGDLRMKRKLRHAGFAGEYRSQDVGSEFPHEYASIAEVDRTFGAVLCLDVIEHLPLEEGLSLLSSLVERVEPGGALVVQTPNGRCIRNGLGNDMTHLHLYNLPDLWAHLTAAGLRVAGYRVVFGARPSGIERLRFLLGAWVTTRLLGADYADNILLVARRP